jgi:hypothetical protein
MGGCGGHEEFVGSSHWRRKTVIGKFVEIQEGVV